MAIWYETLVAGKGAWASWFMIKRDASAHDYEKEVSLGFELLSSSRLDSKVLSWSDQDDQNCHGQRHSSTAAQQHNSRAAEQHSSTAAQQNQQLQVSEYRWSEPRRQTQWGVIGLSWVKEKRKKGTKMKKENTKYYSTNQRKRNKNMLKRSKNYALPLL